VVAGVLGAKPRIVSKLDDVIGKPLSDPAVSRIVCEAVSKQCRPLENVPYEAPYRRRMFEVFTRRAIGGWSRGLSLARLGASMEGSAQDASGNYLCASRSHFGFVRENGRFGRI
jgi:hypothetical protein